MASLPLIATLINASTSLFLIILLLNSPSCTEAENILYPLETLRSGDSLTYGYNYSFRMQRDCDLVLFESEIPIWASGTGGVTNNCYCNVDAYGVLAIYDSDGIPIWLSENHPHNRSTYLLILQKDRDVVIYGPPIWATFETLGRARAPARTLPAANDIGMIEDTNTLYSGETLHTNEFLAYGNQYIFVMRSDCNLALYVSGTVVWTSGTGGKDATNCSCTLLTNGTLVVESPTGELIWNSPGGTGEEGNYLLVLQRNGNVVLYGPSVWSTETKKIQTAAALIQTSIAAA